MHRATGTGYPFGTHEFTPVSGTGYPFGAHEFTPVSSGFVLLDL